MENKSKVILLVVIVSLVLNVMMFNRLNNIKQEVINVRNNNHNNLHMLESRINSINMALGNIREQNKWITATEMKADMEVSKPGEIHLGIEFSLREIEKNAQVFVLYKSENNELWNEALAKNIGGNSFTAHIVLDDKNELYTYQISTKGSLNRTSDIITIPSMYYMARPLEVIYRSEWYGSEKEYFVEYHLVQFSPTFDFHKVKNIEARIYKNNILDIVIDIAEFNNSNENEKLGRYMEYKEFSQVFAFTAQIEPDKTRIVVKAEFLDGSVQEGELFPEERFITKRIYH